jgi:hypothetical protein
VSNVCNHRFSMPFLAKTYQRFTPKTGAVGALVQFESSRGVEGVMGRR